jgi:hypothetical protein
MMMQISVVFKEDTWGLEKSRKQKNHGGTQLLP